jgi:hypothetical protein
MSGFGLHERLMEWLTPPQAPLIDEQTARERCAPVTNADGQRVRLIVVRRQDDSPSSMPAQGAGSRSEDAP